LFSNGAEGFLCSAELNGVITIQKQALFTTPVPAADVYSHNSLAWGFIVTIFFNSVVIKLSHVVVFGTE
jgi:hypothetical protein